jgi:hypothetical protein
VLPAPDERSHQGRVPGEGGGDLGDRVVRELPEVREIDGGPGTAPGGVVPHDEGLRVRDVGADDEHEGDEQRDPADGVRTREPRVAHRQCRQHHSDPDDREHDPHAEHRESERGVVVRHPAQAHGGEPEGEHRHRGVEAPERAAVERLRRADAPDDGEEHGDHHHRPAQLEEAATCVLRRGEPGLADEAIAGVGQRDELRRHERREQRGDRGEHDRRLEGPEPTRPLGVVGLDPPGRAPECEHDDRRERDQRDVTDPGSGVDVGSDELGEDGVGVDEQHEHDREERQRKGHGPNDPRRDRCVVTTDASHRGDGIVAHVDDGASCRPESTHPRRRGRVEDRPLLPEEQRAADERDGEHDVGGGQPRAHPDGQHRDGREPCHQQQPRGPARDRTRHEQQRHGPAERGREHEVGRIAPDPDVDGDAQRQGDDESGGAQLRGADEDGFGRRGGDVEHGPHGTDGAVRGSIVRRRDRVRIT